MDVRPHTAALPIGTLAAGAAVAVAAVLGFSGLVWVHADRALHNYGPERRAVDAFEPPAGAIAGHDVRWGIGPSRGATPVSRAVERFEAWADSGSC
jgi:hypothetical protein